MLVAQNVHQVFLRTSKSKRRLTGSSFFPQLVSIVLNNNNNCPEPDGTAGQPPVNQQLGFEVAPNHDSVPAKYMREI